MLDYFLNNESGKLKKTTNLFILQLVLIQSSVQNSRHVTEEFLLPIKIMPTVLTIEIIFQTKIL